MTKCQKDFVKSLLNVLLEHCIINQNEYDECIREMNFNEDIFVHD